MGAAILGIPEAILPAKPYGQGWLAMCIADKTGGETSANGGAIASRGYRPGIRVPPAVAATRRTRCREAANLRQLGRSAGRLDPRLAGARRDYLAQPRPGAAVAPGESLSAARIRSGRPG